MFIHYCLHVLIVTAPMYQWTISNLPTESTLESDECNASLSIILTRVDGMSVILPSAVDVNLVIMPISSNTCTYIYIAIVNCYSNLHWWWYICLHTLTSYCACKFPCIYITLYVNVVVCVFENDIYSVTHRYSTTKVVCDNNFLVVHSEATG